MKTLIVTELVLMLCVLISPTHVCADSPEDSARMYYASKQYKEVLDIWYGMVISGGATSSVYYNIGLAESHLNQTPRAMIAFEKAQRLNPFRASIKSAIASEREKIENGVIPVRPFFLMEWYRGYLAIFRPGMWALLGLLVLCLAVWRYVRRHLRSSNSRFLPSGPEWIIGGTGLLFILSGFLSYGSLYRQDEAILHLPCEVRQAPSDASPSTLTLHPGEKLVIRDQLTEWYNVRLLNLEEGWIRKDCLTLIRMDEAQP